MYGLSVKGLWEGHTSSRNVEHGPRDNYLLEHVTPNVVTEFATDLASDVTTEVESWHMKNHLELGDA